MKEGTNYASCRGEALFLHKEGQGSRSEGSKEGGDEGPAWGQEEEVINGEATGRQGRCAGGFE